MADRIETAAPTAETLAQSIQQIATVTRSMFKAGLNEKAIIMLISEASGVNKTNVKFVLNHMRRLDREYLTPKLGLPPKPAGR